MAQLPDQAVEEFKELWRRHCGTKLPEEKVKIRAQEVFNVLRLVLEKPASKNEPGVRMRRHSPSASEDLLQSMQTMIFAEKMDS